MKADLREVTLVTTETRCHELGRMAVEDCLAQADFGDVVYFSDLDPQIPGARWIKVEDAPSKQAWCEHYWYEVPQHVHTMQTLTMSWDSWIINPAAWQPRFLEYDYIGAPWDYDDLSVGNSGFSLRSKELMDYLVAHRDLYPVVTAAEDELLCRMYRPSLEAVGFTWAPANVAAQFSFECIMPQWGFKPFGYHAMRHWPLVLSPERLIARAKVAARSPHVCTPGHMGQLLQTAPWLRAVI